MLIAQILDGRVDRAFKIAQHQSNIQQAEVGVWKVTPDIHDADRMRYVVATVAPWPTFPLWESAGFVDSVYPERAKLIPREGLGHE